MCRLPTFVAVEFTVAYLVSVAPVAGQQAARNVAVVPVAPQKWALLIGVNDYAGIRDLKYCSQDVEGLREALVRTGFRPQNIFLLHDAARENKYRPFKANIERELKLVLALAGPQDLIVVAFSGHGVHLDGTSYLCPAEADLSDPAHTMVSLDSVYRRLAASRARQKLLLVDACRNDPRPDGVRSMTSATRSTRQFAESLKSPPQGILVLTSCAPGQVSVEDDQLRHGVFMHFVLQGLAGPADSETATGGNNNGWVSLLELYKYSHDKTERYVARVRSLAQTPQLRGQIAGDYEIAQAPQRRPNRTGRANGGAEPSGPDDPKVTELLRRGDLYFDSGKISQAITAYTQAIQLDPAYAPAYVRRGRAYRAQGDLPRALADFLKANMTLDLQVTSPTAQLKTGEKVIGTVRRGQTLQVTEIKGDWLGVASVDGEPSLYGWIETRHVLPVSAVPRPSADDGSQQYSSPGRGAYHSRSRNLIDAYNSVRPYIPYSVPYLPF